MANIDYDPSRTRRYLKREEVGELIHISRNGVARMEKDKLLPTADVWIATYLRGWDRERMLAFAIDAGILDQHGNKIGDPVRGPGLNNTQKAERRAQTAAIVAERYSQPTRTYLGTALVAALTRRNFYTVCIARYRNTWQRGDVQVGTRFGWDEVATLEFVKRTHRVTEDRIDEWMTERTLDHGLDPREQWITERISSGAASNAAVKAYRKAAKSAGYKLPR